jgi:hypothetical protein
MKIIFSGKRIASFILFAAIGMSGNLFTGGLSQVAQARQVIDWHTVIVAYDAYVDYPSPEHAKALLITLPTDYPSKQAGDKKQALEHIFSEDSYPILLEEATSGDRSTIEVMFRLLNVTDGYLTELVLSELGQIARNWPKQFLGVLAVYKDSGYSREHGYPLSFPGAGYNMHKKAYRYHLQKTIEALKSVKDPKYTEIKEAGIESLLKSIKDLPQLTS